ncbi:hypothetical protein JCM33774_13390 [Actinophytocola sp. KF-1]
MRERVEERVGAVCHVDLVAVRAGDQQRGGRQGVEQLEAEARGEAVGAGVRDLDQQVGPRAQEDAAPTVRGGREEGERAAAVVLRG